MEVSMELLLPEMDELKKSIEELKSLVVDSMVLTQEWYDLDQACKLKGLSKNTLYSMPKYQPGYGKEDTKICGKKRWHRSTIPKWLKETDDDIPKHLQ
jgi:hypothetical protein